MLRVLYDIILPAKSYLLDKGPLNEEGFWKKKKKKKQDRTGLTVWGAYARMLLWSCSAANATALRWRQE